MVASQRRPSLPGFCVPRDSPSPAPPSTGSRSLSDCAPWRRWHPERGDPGLLLSRPRPAQGRSRPAAAVAGHEDDLDLRPPDDGDHLRLDVAAARIKDRQTAHGTADRRRQSPDHAPARARRGAFVNLAYLDPPYNTGRQFTFDDRFSSTEKGTLPSRARWLRWPRGWSPFVSSSAPRASRRSTRRARARPSCSSASRSSGRELPRQHGVGQGQPQGRRQTPRPPTRAHRPRRRDVRRCPPMGAPRRMVNASLTRRGARSPRRRISIRRAGSSTGGSARPRV